MTEFPSIRRAMLERAGIRPAYQPPEISITLAKPAKAKGGFFVHPRAAIATGKSAAAGRTNGQPHLQHAEVRVSTTARDERAPIRTDHGLGREQQRRREGF